MVNWPQFGKGSEKVFVGGFLFYNPYATVKCTILNLGFTVVCHVQKKAKVNAICIWVSCGGLLKRKKKTPKQDISPNPPITFVKWIQSTFLGVQLSWKDKQGCIGCQSKVDQLKLGLRGARPQINEGNIQSFLFYFFFLMYSTQRSLWGFNTWFYILMLYLHQMV